MSAAVRVIDLTEDDVRRLIREELRAALEIRPAPTPQSGAMLSVLQAAERVGCSDDTIRAWIKSGRLPCRRIGVGRGHYRIDPADLERAMQSQGADAPVDVDALARAMMARRQRRAG